MGFAIPGTLKYAAGGQGRYCHIGDTVQEQIKKLQDFITNHYYNCTDEILNGLGQMYICDERMKKNMESCFAFSSSSWFDFTFAFSSYSLYAWVLPHFSLTSFAYWSN